jgi:class 3 adenylate cyclase/tetratricopeptide (TPR) repeat protein
LICSACGTENEPGRKFCGECGTPLVRVCATCGTPNAATAKFCGECGSPLTTGTTAAAPSMAPTLSTPLPAASERRFVSVLFADLVGFTSLSEQRDSEEVRDLLTRYFDTGRRIIERYGGNVEKFIGDAVMAVWGTPTAQEDDAERSVRAALELTQAISQLGAEIGAPDLQARAGVLTGEAAVTLGAEGQGMVAGDLVNTASRIQSAAEPGTVLVGEVTRRATEAAIVYEDAGAHALKGKADRVPLWRAVRVVAGIGGAYKSTGLEPPFVGRDRELRLVKELFHGATEERKAHLVSVVGIAGIGKSRLSWEFFKYLEGLAGLVLWHRGRCLSYGEGVTYWALADMVKMRCRISEGEEPSSAMAKLRTTLEQYIPDLEERRWVEPRLTHLLGLEERTAANPEDLFSAWRVFIERMAEQTPVVMVFEDLQWADAALLDFIEYLLEWSRDFPLFVVTLARPDLLDRRTNWGAGKRNFTSLFLEPLSPQAMHELLSGLVPGLPAELQSKILDRAEGVPLYAVETVRMLLDRGLLVLDESEYRLTGEVDALDVPETLQALIAARLDGLTADERRVLQDAAVLGKVFTKAGAAAVSGLPEQQLDSILTSLIRKEVLSIQVDPRSPEHGQYGFLQDLVKRVAYETVSKKERKAKHLAAAEFLESRWAEDEEIVEVVAAHYLDAYRAAPDAPDAEEIKARARAMLTRAGDRAASLAASEEARRNYEHALELADEPLTQAGLHERAGAMAWAVGNVEAAYRHLEPALAFYQESGQTHAAARVSATMAEVMWNEGRGREAVAKMQAAFDVLSREEPDADLATLAGQLARFSFLGGQVAESAGPIELALELAERLQLPEVFAQSLITRAMIVEAQQRPEEARLLLEHALEVALDNNLWTAALRAYNNLAALHMNRDRFEEAVRTMDRGLELARKAGVPLWTLKLSTARIAPLGYLGRWDQAMSIFEEAREESDLSVMAGIALELLFAGSILIFRGQLDEAATLLRAMGTAEGSDDVQSRVQYASIAGLLLSAQGKNREALDTIRARLPELGIDNAITKEIIVTALEAALLAGDAASAEELLATLEGLQPGEFTPYLRAQTSRFHARFQATRPGGEEVEAGFKLAAGLFRELSTPFWLGTTLLEHAEWLVQGGHAEEAESLIREARELFQALEARPWLERLSALLPAAERVGA